MQILDTTLLQAMGAEETMMARPEHDAAALSRLRYETARVISTRRRVIDALYNDAIASGGERAEAARALRSGNLDVRMRYSEHVSSWPISRAIADWDAYSRACQELGEALRLQVEAERTVLYPGAVFLG